MKIRCVIVVFFLCLGKVNLHAIAGSSCRSTDENVLKKHVSFFDRNQDGTIYPWETFRGLFFLSQILIYLVTFMLFKNSINSSFIIINGKLLLGLYDVKKKKKNQGSVQLDVVISCPPSLPFSLTWVSVAKLVL